MTTTVEPAAYSLKPALRAMMQLYFHDFSEFTKWPVNDAGCFDDYRYLDQYWTESERHPFVIRVDGALAGFALVQVHDGLTSMSEFFVLRAYRGSGTGRELATSLFALYPGRWSIDVMPENTPALAFWERVVTDASGGSFAFGYDECDRRWRYTFTVHG